MEETAIMNWIVTTYDAEDNILKSWTIHNRTESQAEKEAMSDTDLRNVADWSMMPEGAATHEEKDLLLCSG